MRIITRRQTSTNSHVAACASSAAVRADAGDAPFRQIPVAAEAVNPEAKAAEEKLQAVLNMLKSDEAVTTPERKKKKRKP
jgi:hypothetical protein